MKKIKKPISILLSVLMVLSVFAVVPFTASAAVGDTVPESEYLTFTAEEAGSTVTLSVYASSNFRYNLNNSGWNSYTQGTTITLENVGDYVRFSGKDTEFNDYYHVSLTGKVACSGNVMSLRLDDDGKSQGLTDYCYSSMFGDCESLTKAPELPETNLAPHCYELMFSGCTSLTEAPELPATNLADFCYAAMFHNCKSLTDAPELPATNLAVYCYNSMFYGCESLTEAPELPATNLTYCCYAGMFLDCKSLTKLPELAATTLTEACYYMMFSGCENIRISATYDADNYPKEYRIPTTGTGTSADDALSYMFDGTGGEFKGTPNINTTYYVPAPAPTTYTVTWNNWDGTTLKTDTVEEGATPTYNGETPEKAEDANNTYTFAGWKNGETTYAPNELPAVSGDVTYTATFTATEKVVEPPTVTYKTATWNGSEVVIDTANTNNYTVVTSETTSWSNGTYVVDADVTITGRIGVSGIVNLILCDDATLTATQGICVSGGNTLNIFAQSFGDSAGALKVTSGGGANAGIGSNGYQNCGTISINGGNLQVVGGNMSAGIGGGNTKPGGTITINAGNVTAKAGNPDNVYGNPHGGAGIGGGSNGTGGAGNVAIHGGHVIATATGNNSPAAVGGGFARGAQGTVAITDGLVVLAGSNASSAKPCFDYPAHRTVYVEIWEHDHSEFSYSASSNILSAECSSDGCNFIDHQISIKLNAPDKSYDETAYSEAYYSSDSVAHDAAEEFNAATGLNITLDDIEYYKDDAKLPSAPIEVGSYTAMLTVAANGSDYTISDDFEILEPHIHDEVSFKFWEKADSLPATAGNYYLMSDVTISATWTIPSGTTNLCLNGHSITYTGNGDSAIYMNAGRNLNLYDCGTQTRYYVINPSTHRGAVVDEATYKAFEGTKGTFTGGYITSSKKGFASPATENLNSTVNMYGGTVIGCNSATGSAVYSFGKFNIYGGAFIGNYSSNSSNWSGTVYNAGQLTMSGGLIRHNYAYNGAGIFQEIWKGSSCTITGGQIIDNTATNQGGGVFSNDQGSNNAKIYVSGNPEITGNKRGSVENNFFIPTNRGRLIINGELTDGANIGITMQTPGVFTNSSTTDYNVASKFKSDNVNYKVVKNADGQLELRKALFVGHNITLNGDIGVNFFINSAYANFNDAQTATVVFTWDNGNCTKEVNLKNLATDGNGHYKATCDVVAAHMAHKIHAVVYLNGAALDETNDFSVQDYAEELFNHPKEYDTKNRPDELKALAKALLNYGAMAQTMFDSALKEKPDLANKNVGATDLTGVTAEQVTAAIKQANDQNTGADMKQVAADLHANWFTTTVIYLSKNTVKHYFTKADDSFNASAYQGDQNNYYYFVQKENIPAAELDTLQEFKVGDDYTFKYSALDYVVAVINSNMADNAKNIAKALFLYNQAANAYFD